MCRIIGTKLHCDMREMSTKIIWSQYKLTQCGLVTSYGGWQRSGSTLTQVIAWCLMVKFCGIRLRTISQQVTRLLKSLKIVLLKSLPHLPGVNELNLTVICHSAKTVDCLFSTNIITWQTGHCLSAGGQINIKMSSYQYRKSHCGDKTILRSSYLHNAISCTGKMS